MLIAILIRGPNLRLQALAARVLKNTLRLGYKTGKKDIILKLKEEVQEFEEAKPTDLVLIDVIADIEFNHKFVDKFERYLKGTEVMELIDIIFVCLSRLVSLGVNIPKAIFIKLRYNGLRKPK